MITQEQSKYLIQSLGESYGQDLVLDEAGYCTLVALDDHLIHVIYKAEDEEIQLHAVVGDLPKDRNLTTQLLRKFMGANLLWVNSIGSTFAIDANEAALMMQKRYRDGQALEHMFIKFVRQFEAELGFWIEQFQAQDEESVKEMF